MKSSEDPEPEETNEVAVATAAEGPTGVRSGRLYVGVTANVVPVSEPDEGVVDGDVVDVQEPGVPGPGLVVPEGTLDERVTWVSEGETSDERAARASAVFAHEKDANGLDEQELEALGGALTAAVHGPVDEPDGNASRDEWVAYAKSKGAPEDETKPKDDGGLGRDALREKYGSKS